MIAKQDRTYTRTAAALEQKHNFDKTFGDIAGIATDARNAANEANEALEKIEKKMTPDEIFNLLTENGAQKGLYRGEDGTLYVNASYIVSGILRSADGNLYFDLDGNVLMLGDKMPYRFLMNPVAITGRKYTGEEYNELLNIAINSGHAVITDNTHDGEPQGIELYGKGGTTLGTLSSPTFLNGSLISVNGTNLMNFIAEVESRLSALESTE